MIMKRIILFICLFALFHGCTRDNIDVYQDNNYIQFSKYLADSSMCSFLAYPNEEELLFPVIVEVVGFPVPQDREYQISVFGDYTTASQEHYELPEHFIMKAGCVVDTCWIVFKKTEDLATESQRLTIQLDETSDFELGQVEKRRNIIYVSNVISKPEWWTSSVTSSYLGKYSDKKYRLFIEQTGKADLDPDNITELRYYSIIFKNYLLKEKDAGRTVKEEDGTEMTVSLIGG